MPSPDLWSNEPPAWVQALVTIGAILILGWGLTTACEVGTLREAELPHVARPATGGMVSLIQKETKNGH